MADQPIQDADTERLDAGIMREGLVALSRADAYIAAAMIELESLPESSRPVATWLADLRWVRENIAAHFDVVEADG